jgi:amylosucrase
MSSTPKPDLDKLRCRLLHEPLRYLDKVDQDIFCLRFEQHITDVLRPLRSLYGHRPDFEAYLARFLDSVARAYADRPADLRLLDLKRSFEPDWFQQSTMIGYVAYTDRFSGDLKGVAERIDYLKELEVTYLHLMPLLKPRPQPNDGGYAVMDYRAVRPDLGTMEDLRDLADQLRRHNVSLCIDLVLNHTAKEHEWAQRALLGDPYYQDYYLMFASRTLPDQYEEALPEIFPDFAPGNFSYYEGIDRWVWTTFNEYQWDLNYANPAVFGEILDNMLFLANQGVEILRLDAVAFMWKRLGTDSQNQPEVHWLLQAFRALTRIAAPGVLFKAEAIVAPDRLIPYLGRGAAANRQCELAYNNSLMVLLWSSLASRKADLMTHSIQQMPAAPSGCAWVTYVRCHDDIGWAVTDENAAAVGLSGPLHRAFLSDFYSGRFPGSFARGATFQYNPKTGDRRISGALASLAGLEVALEGRDPREVELAVARVLLIHNCVFAFGGIPVIYMGDELGMLNDMSYLDDPGLSADNRWMHRPFMNWRLAESRHNPQSPTGAIFQGLRTLIAARRRTFALHAQAATYAVWTDNVHVAGLIRMSPRGRLLILGNLSEWPQTISGERMRVLGFEGPLVEHLSQEQMDGWQPVRLEPYQAVWLEKAEDLFLSPSQR